MTKKMKFDKPIKSDSKFENESVFSNSNNNLNLNNFQSEIIIKDNLVENKNYLVKVYEPKKIESHSHFQDKKMDIENIEKSNNDINNTQYSVKYFQPTTQNIINFNATQPENNNVTSSPNSFKKECRSKGNDQFSTDKKLLNSNFIPKKNSQKMKNKFIEYFHGSKETLNKIFHELDDTCNQLASKNAENSNSIERNFQKDIDNQEFYKQEIQDNKIINENSENKLINSEIDAIEIEKNSFQKESFKLLKIIGQFNLGFIITYSSESNQIFIIDQHAADEKTNYERLMKNYQFQLQLLITPLNLNHLTQLELHTIKNNPTIFEKNGFSLDFKQDSNNQFQDIYLKALPCFKNIQFDLNDFYELLRNVQSSENYSEEAIRPKKVQTSIAFKACRGSKMVGDPLSLKEMESIVFKLSELQSPWNCPHGRPTMIKSDSLSNILEKIQFKRL